MHVVTRATTLTAFRDAAPAADVALPAAAMHRGARRDAPHDLVLRIHGDLANVEAEWRRFEAIADCTVFQTFDWLAAWHRHIGLRARVQPARMTSISPASTSRSMVRTPFVAGASGSAAERY